MKSAYTTILFSAIAVMAAASGCQSYCGGRTFRCDDGGPSGFSGRFEACGDCQANGIDCTHGGQFSAAGMIRRAMTCSAGCGEIYYDEWANDPPQCACDCDGNHVGSQPCPPRPIFWRLRGMFSGQRLHQANCGCSSCGSESVQWIDETEVPSAGPAQKPTPASQETAEKKWARRVNYSR